MGPPRPIRFPKVSVQEDGPLHTVLVSRRGMPILDLHLVFRYGAAADPQELPGCASMTAATLDTGTARRSQREIAKRLESMGTALTVQTAWDHCSIGLRVLSDRLQPALDLLAELVCDAAFPAPEHELRKQLRLEEILQEQDEPHVVAAHAIARAVFGADHPYGRPYAGTHDSIAALKRENVAAFHAARFRPAGAFLVVAGDMDSAGMKRATHGAFGRWNAPDHGEIVPAPDPGPIVPRICLIDRPGAPQSEIRIGTVGAARGSRDFFALLVLNTILGGSFTSRLNTRLREEKGYTYGAFSRFAFRRARGPFVAGAAVDAEATHLAIADTLDVMHKIRVEDVPEDEIDRARRYLALGMVHGLETNAGVAARAAEVEIHGLGEGYYDSYVDRIGAVTAAQVRDAAERYLGRDRLAVVVVGDAAATWRSLESLGIGPVVEASSVA